MTTTENGPGAQSGELDLAAEVTKMSTQPEAVTPTKEGERRSLWKRLVRGWRVLTSMRTALLLLFLLALAAIPGSLLPQRGLNPVRVTGFFVNHPSLAPKLDKLSLFDVFAAPWFAAIYALLFISLVGCVLPRLRVHWRALRTPPPKTPKHLHRLAFNASWETEAKPDEVLAALRTTLKRKRWKTILREDGLAAEAGRQRETGNLVFHASLILLLLGIALGSIFGYQGTVLVSEGNTFTNTVISYDQFKPGRLVSTSKLTPFSFTLDDFAATYQRSGEGKSFDAHVTYANSLGGQKHTYDLRVNHPLRFGSSTLYLLGHGYTLHVVAKDAKGNVAYDDKVPCLPQDGVFTSICTIKIPGTSPQVGILGFLFPTAAFDPINQNVVSEFPALNRPNLSIRAFTGDLGLSSGRPQSVYTLDTDKMKVAIESDVIDLRNPEETTIKGLPGGTTVSLEGVSEWATFQVKRDPAKKLTFIASVLIVAGLTASLFIKRRRLWVRATEKDGRTLVEVGALTRTDADDFGTAFQLLLEDLRQQAPAAASSETGTAAPAAAPEAEAPEAPQQGDAT